MQTIRIQRDFNTDAAIVFDVITDHAAYTNLPGVRRAYLRRAGSSQRRGVGAERVLCLPAVCLVERITEYVPGELLGYRIIESPLPIHHFGAQIRLEPLDRDLAYTRVHWISRLRGTTPVGASLLERNIARQMRLGYAAALRIWAWRLRRI